MCIFVIGSCASQHVHHVVELKRLSCDFLPFF